MLWNAPRAKALFDRARDAPPGFDVPGGRNKESDLLFAAGSDCAVGLCDFIDEVTDAEDFKSRSVLVARFLAFV